MTRQHEKNNTASAAEPNSQTNSPETLTYGLGWVEVQQNSAISSQKSLSLRNRRPKNLGDKTDTHRKKQLKAKVRGR